MATVTLYAVIQIKIEVPDAVENKRGYAGDVLNDCDYQFTYNNNALETSWIDVLEESPI